VRRRLAILFGAGLAIAATLAPAARSGAAPAAPHSGESSLRFLRDHGYLVGDPARFARLKAEAAAKAARLHPPASRTPVSAHNPVANPSWEGLNEDDLAPPDPTGAIGPNSYVQTINLQLGIYSRTGSLIASNTFANLTGAGSDFLSDPQVLWDPQTNRFYYNILDVGGETNPKSTMLWGFSKSSTPTSIPGSFCNYTTDFGWGGTIADYPKLGQTSDFLLIGVNIYPNLVTFLESDVGWITKPKSNKPVSTCPAVSKFKTGKVTDLLNDDGVTNSSTPEPAKQVDPSSDGWIAAVPDPTNSGASGTKLELYHVTKNQDGTPNIPQVGTAVPVAQYDPPAPAVQQGSAHTIDTLDGRLTNSISAVDPAHGNATALWTQHTVFGGGGAEVRWYEIDVAHATPFQSGVVTDPNLFTFNGGASPDRVWRSANKKGFGSDVVVGFTTSSSSAYPAIQMVSKIGAGAQSAYVLVKQSPGPDDGFDCFELGKCRWGDYAGAAPDPAASLSGSTGKVWLTNEWADGDIDPLFATWRTWNWAATP